jgi:hypothetical protein
MRSPSCGFTKRLIVLSICLCGLLAFSSTLSADTYTFYPARGIPGLAADQGVAGSQIGPYAGTLYLPNGTQSPDQIFFCLTGNAYYITPDETGTWAAPSTTAYDESAFLVSLMLGNEVADSVTLNVLQGSTPAGKDSRNYEYVNPNGTGANITTFENGTSGSGAGVKPGLGQIQLAIWDVNGTLPSGISYNMLDAETKYIIGLAVTYANYSVFNGNSNYMVFTSCSGGQNFIEVPSVPEPGTMVLFGAGAVLMGLGCARRRLAKRPR